jgi:flagellar biosynthesis/type III secretory pathway protein FliH
MWLSRLLRSWLKNDNIPEFEELKEVDSMLAETITEWTEQWKAEGKVEGKAEGKVEGKAEGRIEEKFNMIKRLCNFNMPLEQIAIVVNLSIDKIKKVLEAGEKGIELIQEQDLM